jgi:hypothetical protein
MEKMGYIQLRGKMSRGPRRIFSDAERLERKRPRSRKENMTPEQIMHHNRRGRKENLTPEQLEKKNARSRKVNLTPEELEKKRSKNRISDMNDERAERARQSARTRMKLRRDTDIMFKVTSHVSRLVALMLKSNKSSKVGKSIREYLLWDNLQLKEHIERQFEPWMNWNNYGKYNSQTWNDVDITTWTWQLDHIIPRSDLPYSSMEDDNFKKCWALENLRPLSAKQNILDGTSRIRHLNKGKK